MLENMPQCLNLHNQKGKEEQKKRERKKEKKKERKEKIHKTGPVE
jgi:hypothetical protein